MMRLNENAGLYRLFGLAVRCDIPLFAPVCELKNTYTDIMIRAENQESRASKQAMTPSLSLDIPGVAAFQIQAGKQIIYTPYADATEDDLRLYLLGSCMGALLQQRGLIVLHGNAMTWDNQTCHIYVGEQGAGKSTTAAWFYQQGASIMADDVCAIMLNAEGRPVVLPSFPQIKLWQASADLLGISTVDLKRVRTAFDKYILPIESDRFAKQPCEIKAIFEINQHINTKQQITGLKKLFKLQQHSYRYYFLDKMGLAHDYLKQLMQLANQVALIEMPRIHCEEAYVES